MSVIAHKDALKKEIAKLCSILSMEKAEKQGKFVMFILQHTLGEGTTDAGTSMWPQK